MLGLSFRVTSQFLTFGATVVGQSILLVNAGSLCFCLCSGISPTTVSWAIPCKAFSDNCLSDINSIQIANTYQAITTALTIEFTRHFSLHHEPSHKCRCIRTERLALFGGRHTIQANRYSTDLDRVAIPYVSDLPCKCRFIGPGSIQEEEQSGNARPQSQIRCSEMCLGNLQDHLRVHALIIALSVPRAPRI